MFTCISQVPILLETLRLFTTQHFMYLVNEEKTVDVRVYQNSTLDFFKWTQLYCVFLCEKQCTSFLYNIERFRKKPIFFSLLANTLAVYFKLFYAEYRFSSEYYKKRPDDNYDIMYSA